MKSWLIPEAALNPLIDPIFDCRFFDNEICISGFVRSGKTIALMHILLHLHKISKCSLLLLVYNKLNVEVIRKELKEIGLNVEVETYWQFKYKPSKHDYILCDDVQLIGSSMLQLIKNNSNHVIVAINPYLTVSEKSVVSDEPPLTLEQIQMIIQPKLFELHCSFINPLINDAARTLTGKDTIRIQRLDSSRRYTPISICETSNVNEEIKYVINNIATRGCSVGVLVPTNKGILSFVQDLLRLKGKERWQEKTDQWGRIDITNLNKYLSSIGLNYQWVGSNFCILPEIENKTSILTYHASMGISFDYVFLPFLNSDLYISSSVATSRNLLALAITRARENVYLTYSGTVHPFLSDIKDNCSFVNVCDTD